jgi:hypothetical protein
MQGNLKTYNSTLEEQISQTVIGFERHKERALTSKQRIALLKNDIDKIVSYREELAMNISVFSA